MFIVIEMEFFSTVSTLYGTNAKSFLQFTAETEKIYGLLRVSDDFSGYYSALHWGGSTFAHIGLNLCFI